MKKLSFLFLLSALLFTGCSRVKNEPFTIYHATDMHYMSQSLTDNSPAFIQMIYEGDGKMVHYIDPLCDAFTEQVVEQKPDALLIGGDISFNGELLSNEDFAKKLRLVEQAGTQVLVIPGNHDVDYPFCFAYEGDYYKSTDRMTKEDFERIYREFGLSQAYSRDKNSFSYFYKVKDNLVVLAVDSNTNGDSYIKEETFAWMEKELKKIKKGTVVIALTHQNVVDRFGEGNFMVQYTIRDNQRLLELFEKYNVQLNLSGHIHAQSIARHGNVTDIATASLALMDGQYGVINYDGEKLSYSTAVTDVDGWAEKTGQTDENLLNYSRYSNEFFTDSARDKALSSMENDNIAREDKALIADLFAQFNRRYFKGEFYLHKQRLMDSEGYKALLEKGSDTRHYGYITSTFEDENSQRDNTHWEKIINN